jgi:hypothetical protein
MSNVGYANPPLNHRFEPGQSGNPTGRPKGSKNLSTIVRELEKEDFDWSLIPLKLEELKSMSGSPWRAVVYAALAKACEGDVKAAEWLRKSAYGNRATIGDEEARRTEEPLIVSAIQPRRSASLEDETDPS